MKKLRFPAEAAFLVALVLQAVGVAMCAASDMGLSMIVAPSYIVSLKLDFLTFGQSEYVMQFLLFVLMCILVKRFSFSYLFSIVSLLIYGAALDIWRIIIPVLNPAVTAPGAASFTYPVRCILFICGMLIVQFTIALSFKTYLTPLVTDFFVKEVAMYRNMNRARLKTVFDVSYMALSIILGFVLFGTLKGVGPGTVLQCLTNGLIVGFFDRGLDKVFDFSPLSEKLQKRFEA